MRRRGRVGKVGERGVGAAREQAGRGGLWAGSYCFFFCLLLWIFMSFDALSLLWVFRCCVVLFCGCLGLLERAGKGSGNFGSVE
jgi:hypothetical protein